MKYKTALEMNDKDVPSLISYRDTNAEAMNRKAVELDTTNVDALNHYALLKQNIYKDYDQADEMYKKEISG